MPVLPTTQEIEAEPTLEALSLRPVWETLPLKKLLLTQGTGK